jgi:hypothetical protein
VPCAGARKLPWASYGVGSCAGASRTGDECDAGVAAAAAAGDMGCTIAVFAGGRASRARAEGHSVADDGMGCERMGCEPASVSAAEHDSRGGRLAVSQDGETRQADVGLASWAVDRGAVAFTNGRRPKTKQPL